ncbi:MAG: Calx-beta domain-containing protein [Candidatus Thiodiazotropha sp.]
MLKRLITAIIWAGLGYLPALHGAAALTANVDKLVEQANSTARIPVIIKFKKTIDINEFRELNNRKHQYEPTLGKSQSQQKKLFRQRLLRSLKDQIAEPKSKLLKRLHQHGIKVQLKSLWAINAVALQLPADLVDDIAAMPEVEQITVDMRLSMSESRVDEVTVDPLWNLLNINTDQLWLQGVTGEGVTVAIMDSGVELNHPDLTENWRGGSNSWFDPYQQHELPTDTAGHGTQALGIILAGDESGYQIGMAPEAEWIAAKIFDNANESTLSAIHESFQWLLDPDGDPMTDDAPDLVNNSWGFSNTINECYQEFSEDIRLLREAGIGVVFSAGNFGPASESSISPANDPGALSVGSVDQSNQIDLLSSRGPGACDGGVFPKLVAPGSLIFTTDLLPSAYNIVSGTSFSAPHVTGAMVLLKSAFPEATLSQLETALYDSAQDLGTAEADDEYGYGLIDVAAAYRLLENLFASSESGRIEFSEALYSVDEDTDKLIVTVRRLGGSKGEVSVDYRTQQDSARQDRDYVGSKGTLHFTEGETLRSFEVPINDDSLDEENESFYLSLSDVEGNATLGEIAEAEVIILDNDGAGSISFATIAYAVNESKQKAIVDIIRTEGSSGVVDVDYQLLAKSADAGIDFNDASETVRFQPGETKKQIHIELIDDKLFEGNETFQCLLSSVSEGASITEPASTTVTILDDDPNSEKASIYLDAVSYEANESVGKVTLTVIRSGDLEASLSVHYETLDGSAKKSEDYRQTSGMLKFSPGVTRRTISIVILDDGLYEEESSFTLMLSDASADATITTPAAAIIRITDDDALPFVSINASSSRNTGGLGSGFSKFGDSIKSKGSITSKTRNGPNSGTSLQIYDLSLKAYRTDTLIDQLKLQGLLENSKQQPKDDDTNDKLEQHERSECSSVTNSSAAGSCTADDGVESKLGSQDIDDRPVESPHRGIESSNSAADVITEPDQADSPPIK